MKVKDLIEDLQKLPQDATIELGKLMALDVEQDEAYNFRLDLPIIGIAVSDDHKDALLVVEYLKNEVYSRVFGTLTKFEES
jgi:hypothetical protein